MKQTSGHLWAAPFLSPDCPIKTLAGAIKAGGAGGVRARGSGRTADTILPRGPPRAAPRVPAAPIDGDRRTAQTNDGRREVCLNQANLKFLSSAASLKMAASQAMRNRITGGR
jgi:hypothetical protein